MFNTGCRTIVKLMCVGVVCLTDDIGLVKAVLCAGLYPHVAKVDKVPKPGAPPYKSVLFIYL